MKALILILIPFLTTAQFNDQWHDLTNALYNKSEGWSIGNACGEDYFMQGIIKEPLDMEGGNLEILYGYIIIEGDITNVGSIVYMCDASILELNGGTLSMMNDPIKPELKIYPNPAVSEINISGVEVKELELYDMTGRRLKHYQTFGMLHKIMVDDLEAGVYILIINGNISHKFVKR